MEARIARHRAEQAQGWVTPRRTYDVVAACGSLAGRVDVVVLDCLTLWVDQSPDPRDEDKSILAAADTLAEFLAERRFTIVHRLQRGRAACPGTDVRAALPRCARRRQPAHRRRRGSRHLHVAGLSMIVKDVPPHEPFREHLQKLLDRIVKPTAPPGFRRSGRSTS